MNMHGWPDRILRRWIVESSELAFGHRLLAEESAARDHEAQGRGFADELKRREIERAIQEAAGI